MSLIVKQLFIAVCDYRPDAVAERTALAKEHEQDMAVNAADIRKILIVDDSSLARGMGRNLLSRIFPDAAFSEGKDVASGFEVWNDVRPDLSFLDLNMPGGTGLDLAERIRAIDPDASIVLCTANIQDVIRERAAGLGIGFLDKPITIEKVESLMGQKAAQ